MPPPVPTWCGFGNESPEEEPVDTRRPVRNVNARWSRTVGILVLFSVLVTISAPVPATARQEEGLRIVVIDGEDSVNVIGQGTAVATVVEVRDRNDLPVSGASVLFLLGEGGTATLNAGLSQVAVTTNALGQAAVTVNPLASGAVQLQVSAAFQGQTATAAIVQTNLATGAAVGATGGAAGTAGAGGGTGGGAGGATGAAAGGGTGGGLGTGGVVGVVAGSVGAAVAGVAVARDAAPAPPVAALRITPNGIGMAGLTEYRFDGSSSADPNEDVLTYSWDFGDGSRGSGVTATHIYAAAGTYEVTLTVNDGSAEATSRGSAQVGPNLNARFEGVQFWTPDPGEDENDCGSWYITKTVDLRQDGRTLSGNLDSFSTRPESSHCSPHHFYYSVSGSLGSSDFVCPCDMRLEFQPTGGTYGPVDNGDHAWTGTVAAGADSIDVGFAVLRRQ